ncbi:MAG: hypothetical protein PF542_01225 [Nanoarchaeota archaeon]|nr:hypothetical protein [Nanoarchaeota archaeon]
MTIVARIKNAASSMLNNAKNKLCKIIARIQANIIKPVFLNVKLNNLFGSIFIF